MPDFVPASVIKSRLRRWCCHLGDCYCVHARLVRLGNAKVLNNKLTSPGTMSGVTKEKDCKKIPGKSRGIYSTNNY